MKYKILPSLGLVLLLCAALFSLGMFPHSPPDNIELGYFKADARYPDEISLLWGTESETDIFGFTIERCLPDGNVQNCEITQDANYSEISPLIPSEGGLIGDDYYFIDIDVTEDVTYYYRLRVDNTDQSQDFYGPVWGIPGGESTPTATVSPTPTSTGSVQDTPTPTTTPTATTSATPTITPTGPSPTPSNTPTPSATRTATVTTPTRTVAAPVVSFTPEPSITPTPSETPTETPTPTITLTPSTTLMPLPTITLLWPTDPPTVTATPRRFTTATRQPAFTATPDAAPSSPITLRTGFLIAVVGALWLLMGAFLFTYLRRLGQ